ncbi:MAG: D-sedoheptulose 7-phosphate isomerase [Magnetococcus sp. WYHC-3]
MVDFLASLDDHAQMVECLRDLLPDLRAAARELCALMARGGRLLVCGNGGSAADAQHMAAELVGRFARERRPLPALALTTDSSILTSVGNDYGFDTVFSRQVEALGRPGDALLVLSTSGHSPNIIAALDKARSMGLLTVGLGGKDGGSMAGLCDHLLVVPSHQTPRIQEGHGLLVHLLCDWIEAAMLQPHPTCSEGTQTHRSVGEGP